MEFFHNVFLEDLKDLSGYRINKALKVWRKTNSNFPTIADIRRIAQDFDYDLTLPEQKHRIMHQRARNKNMGIFMMSVAEQDLINYEEKHGKLNVSVGWAQSYDETFNN